MAPRPPPETPDEERQSELLKAVHRALDDALPVNDTDEDRRLAGIEQDPLPPLPADEAEIDDERIEAYLRGPTAFTA